MPHSRKRLVVLGLDGLPLALARALAASGRLPNLERLLALNATSIEAELPELSPVNWTSFMTAANPGRHGVFGFVGIDPASEGGPVGTHRTRRNERYDFILWSVMGGIALVVIASSLWRGVQERKAKGP